jgi:hypothetical protein
MQNNQRSIVKPIVFGFAVLSVGQVFIAAVMISGNIPNLGSELRVKAVAVVSAMMSANPIYHLKDAYFFEVPKGLWRYDWKSLDEVPAFLRNGHPDVTDVGAFNRAMDGKVLIPQPFGEIDSLYAKKSGLAISKYMLLELVVAAIMLLFSHGWQNNSVTGEDHAAASQICLKPSWSSFGTKSPARRLMIRPAMDTTTVKRRPGPPGTPIRADALDALFLCS